MGGCDEASPGALPRRSSRQKSWRRRLLFAAVALSFGLVLAGVAAEIAARVAWEMPPQFAMFDQVGLYVDEDDGVIGLLPGFRGVLEVRNGDLPTNVRVNALGLRGAEVPEPAPGQRRVLVLGDSLVFGFAVEEEDTLPVRLESALRARGVAAVCGNAGIPGLGTKQTVERMAALDARFEPDAFVLCSYLGNDALDDLWTQDVVCAGLRFTGHLAKVASESWRFRLAVRSRAALWLETWIFTNEPAWSPLLQVPPDPQERAAMRGLPGNYPAFAGAFAGIFLDAVDEQRSWDPAVPPIIPRVLENLRSSLERAREVAGDRPLLFVVLPSIWQYDEERRRDTIERLGPDPAAFEIGLSQRRWLAAAGASDVPAVDVTQRLRAVEDQAGLFCDGGGHYSGRGAEIVAERIAEALVTLLR